MPLKHHWLDEGSGWNLLLPESLLSSWHGNSSDDYQRFGAAGSGWLTQLPVADGFGFVLGGDPGMVLVSPHSDGTTRLIRWHAADSEDELIAFALSGVCVQQTEPDIVFENREPHWLLFDAAADPAIEKPSTLAVSLPTGHLRIQTAFVQDSGNAAIVHTIGHDRTGWSELRALLDGRRS